MNAESESNQQKTPASTAGDGRGRLLTEGLWVAGGQMTSAVAALAGVRLITEVAAPSLYGSFVLANGILTLVQGIALQPMAQAALRHYPDFKAENAVGALESHLRKAYRRHWLFSTLLFAVGAVADAVLLGGQFSEAAWALLAFGMAIECWKAHAIVMRNAARLQRQYATLVAADSLARPIGTVLCAVAIDVSLETLLLGQCLGSLVAMLLLARRGRGARTSGSTTARASHVGLFHRMARFAAPLVWLPAVGWISGQSDRYVVGSMLSFADAGLYAAAYGLASRPFLMLGTITEATLRQPLYGAVSRHDGDATRSILRAWLTINMAAGATLWLLIAAASDWLVGWLLAQPYRAVASQLLPWLAGGYALSLINQTVERLLYAWGHTARITMLQALGAATTVLLTAAGAHFAGLAGVAAAVLVAFGAQLLMSLLVARSVTPVPHTSESNSP